MICRRCMCEIAPADMPGHVWTLPFRIRPNSDRIEDAEGWQLGTLEEVRILNAWGEALSAMTSAPQYNPIRHKVRQPPPLPDEA